MPQAAIAVTPEVTANAQKAKSLGDLTVGADTAFYKFVSNYAKHVADLAHPDTDHSQSYYVYDHKTNQYSENPLYPKDWNATHDEAYNRAMEVRERWIANYFKVRGQEGWVFLGSGAFRRAFLGPDGLVYKVAKGPDDVKDNEMDARISEMLRDKKGCPKKFRIPFMTLVEQVIVTYPVRGDERDWDEDEATKKQHRRFLTWCRSHGVRVHDGWTNNIMYSAAEDCWYATDMGNWEVGGKNKFGKSWS